MAQTIATDKTLGFSLVIVEAWVRYTLFPCMMLRKERKGLSLSTLIFPVIYLSTKAS
jgi:hypothetical protein